MSGKLSNLGRNRGRQASGSGWHLDPLPSVQCQFVSPGLGRESLGVPRVRSSLSSDAVHRIETLVDPDSFEPMDEDLQVWTLCPLWT